MSRERPDPAVPTNKPITKNHIICLEDGAKLKMLKRYLSVLDEPIPDNLKRLVEMLRQNGKTR